MHSLNKLGLLRHLPVGGLTGAIWEDSAMSWNTSRLLPHIRFQTPDPPATCPARGDDDMRGLLWKQAMRGYGLVPQNGLLKR